ncbi:MAG: hypothetical protein ACOVP4_10195 [Bacteriovoracaceae bacterium]
MKTLLFISVVALSTDLAHAVNILDGDWKSSNMNREKLDGKGQVIGKVDDTQNQNKPNDPKVNNPVVDTQNDRPSGSTTVNSDVVNCIDKNQITPTSLPRCIAIRLAAGLSGLSGTETDNDSSKDKMINCKLKSPTNQDWVVCQQGIKTYNTLTGLDGAMQLSTGIQSQLAQDKIQKETMKEAQAGNLQTAALQATADQNLANAKLLEQQASFYGGQAAYLETFVATKWPSKVKTVCNAKRIAEVKNIVAKNIGDAISLAYPGNTNGAQSQTQPTKVEVAGVSFGMSNQPNVAASITEANCIKILDSGFIKKSTELFPNSSARSALQNKAIESIGKAAKAGIDANRLRKNAKVAETLKDQFVDPGGDAMFDLCRIDPANVQCRGTGTRVNQPGYQAGQFNLDGGGNGQAFNLNPNAGTGEEIGNIGTGEATNIAGVTSPFADEADKASDLLDQAGGASYTSAGAGGGGGGGVGGGGGGGSAALGGDLQGAEKDDKEAEIKASKRDGGYASGGGGFQATGSGSSDENPLQSLFDQDGAKGGIEEDRSIASEDIDNSNSALFEKISKKYAKVHGEKRIEANNLE